MIRKPSFNAFHPKYKYRLWGWLAIGLIFMFASLTYLTHVGNRSACEARWSKTDKQVTYSYMTGCLVETTKPKEGAMVPEMTITTPVLPSQEAK